MDITRFIVGVILPYVAIVVFAVGMIWRIRTWRKLASPPMTLFPAPADAKANTRNTLKEAFLFSSLFKGDRVLWSVAWVFHVVLALIFVGHFRVFTNVDALLTASGMSEDSIHAMSGGVGGAAGVIILILVALLLVRRMTLQRVREITGAADYLALILIAAIIITGNMMRFGGEHFDLALTREYFADLATFGNAGQAAALKNNVFLAHLGLAFLLIMCMPFSKLLHFGGIFFTHQLVRKR
ncbi:MAG: respiratory nitrate reductase subunit gamma [Planctomycetota bacterium]|jgi:nitrate reductase gamma subunit